MDKENRKSRYSVVTLEGTVEAKDIPLGTSVQKAELSALTRALEFLHEKRVTVNADSRYTFLMLCAHGSISKEKGLLTLNY